MYQLLRIITAFNWHKVPAVVWAKDETTPINQSALFGVPHLTNRRPLSWAAGYCKSSMRPCAVNIVNIWEKYYLNECWSINRTFGDRFQRNLNQNIMIGIRENVYENVMCKMAVILSRPRYMKQWRARPAMLDTCSKRMAGWGINLSHMTCLIMRSVWYVVAYLYNSILYNRIWPANLHCKTGPLSTPFEQHMNYTRRLYWCMMCYQVC